MTDNVALLKERLPDIQECCPDLIKESSNSLCGPCPVCGGQDRFVCKIDSGISFCRQCHPAGMDKIDYQSWRYGKTVKELFKEYLPDMPTGKGPGGKTPSLPGKAENPADHNFRNTTSKFDAKGITAKLKDFWDNHCSNQAPGGIKQFLHDRRGLSEKTIDSIIKTGSAKSKKHAGKQSMMVRYTTLQGEEIMAAQAISLDGKFFPFTAKGDGEPKNKVFVKGSKAGGDCFFMCGADVTKFTVQEKGIVILNESVINAITAFEWFPNACCIALGGSTYTAKVKALKPYLEHVEKVIVCVDNDSASEKMLRAIWDILGSKVYSFKWDSDKDWNSDDDPDGFDINDALQTGQAERAIRLIKNAERISYKIELEPQKISPELLKSEALALSQGDIEIISAEEIRTLNPQVEPLVEGYLNKGDNTLIVAPGGLGKSMLSTHMALEFAVPFPGKLFDRFPIKTKMPSLFFQTENSMATVNSRLSKMAGDNPEYQEAMKYINFPFITDNILSISKSLENPEAVFWFIEAIKAAEKHQGQKIITVWWDPFVSFHDGQENDAGRMRAALDAVTYIAQATDITPIIIHHNNKNGDYRGSSAILDWGRNMISLSREFIGEDRITDIDSQGKVKGRRIAQIPCIRVKHEKSNNMPLFESFLLRMTDKLRFEAVTESIPAKQMEDCNAVSQALFDMGGFSASHNVLVKAYCEFSGVSPSTAKRHITEAVKNQFIQRESTTINGKPAYAYHSIEN